MHKRSEIAQLGEFGLIERIEKKFKSRDETTVKGIGDDAAVMESGQEFLLLSTDMLLEGPHFDLSYVPLKHLGYKAVSVNVSDIAAMNGRPRQIIVGLGLSNRFSLEAVDELYEGVRAACDSFGVDLVGGDTSSSGAGLVISVAILGRVAKEKITYRKGAKVNDIICVTGDLGASYLGLQILEREKAVFLTNPAMQPSLEKYEYLVGRQLKPEARTDIIYELDDRRVIPTSMIDVSDGLASELLHLSFQSGLGMKVFEDKLPIDSRTFETALEFRVDPITCALNGGEDYELLFTISPAAFEKVKEHPDIHFIGHVHDNAQRNVLITKQGSEVQIKAQGWDHFSKETTGG